MVYALDRDLSWFSVTSSNLKLCQIDLDQELELANLCNSITSQGGVDIIVNNAYDWKAAGFGDQSARLETMSSEGFVGSLKTDWWAVKLAQLFVTGMRARGNGNIINIASMYGLVAPDPSLYEDTDYFNPASYGMAKAAMVALTRYMAAWLGPEIRANALVPGAFPNYGDSDNSKQNQNQQFTERLKRRTLLKRLGVPKTDLVGPLLFLASDASRYMTGQTLVIDGGWTVT
ncbi:MAG: 2-keto-3-deoxy-L-fuconate dehydrogenase [Bacteroidetes bacterium ADurb.Bin416]|nr:MAG: 2-keto-3-deoxy-L-fuconate dehydrogenase [Bacteroidetes bacterium ADurb.Bin416]